MEYNFDFGSSSFAAWFAGIGIIVILLCIGAGIGLAFIPASIAKRKGYSAGAFWCIGFFGGFILGTIIACAIPDRTVPPPWYKPAMQPVGYAPPPPPRPQPTVQPVVQPAAQPTAQKVCPQCGASCKDDAAFCLKCGSKL